jgi:hypothetical protein
LTDRSTRDIRANVVSRIANRADVIALLVLLAGIVIVSFHRFYYDNWLARHDLLAFFLPWHGFLGQYLRDFTIPGWNPTVFAGTPFLGDPESGWMYFPAVVLFPFLQITVALKAMILVQLLIGGGSTYSLGRVLGFGTLGSLLSATAFTFGPFLMAQTECCTVGAGLSGWIPMALLGVELGLRSRRWLFRFGAWAISGVAVSQMLAVWLGQGAAVGLLIVGLWVGYRGLIDPPNGADIKLRIEQTISAGLTVLGTGIGISAAGLLPRLAVNAESTIQGGDYSRAPGGADENPIPIAGAIDYLLRDNRIGRESAIGAAVLVLVILAVLLARRRYATPFFVGTWIAILALSVPRNVFHDIFFLIPKFEELQMHSPTRVFWMTSILPSLAAGAGLKALLDNRGNARLLPVTLVPPVAVHLLRTYLEDNGRTVEGSVIAVSWIASAIAALILVPWQNLLPAWKETVPRVAAALLIVLIFAWPNVPEIVDTIRDPHGDPGQLQMWGKDAWVEDVVGDTLTTNPSGGAGAFLQELRDDGELFRYVSYAGNYSELGPNISAPGRRLEPAMIALLVNGQPMQLNLQHISGYNPLQMLTFLEYLAVANSRVQDYHHADVTAAGASSPLLDMLNVRYFLVSTTLDPNRADVQAFASQGPEVYRDDLVVIYRNDSAFDRAWMVHDVRSSAEGGLALLGSGTVDGRTVAYVDDYQPGDFPVAPVSASGDVVTFASWDANSMELDVTAGSDGLLVLGEIDADGWTAWVDGEEVDIVRANHTLRGIPVTAGEHTVKLRYTAPYFGLGMWISRFTGLAMLAVWGVIVAEWVRRRG